MKDSFISQGKKYISARRASEISDYSSDYIGQLCRTKKLDCQMVGRVWFVSEESLQLHRSNVLQNEVYRNRVANLHGSRKADEILGVTEVGNPVIEALQTPKFAEEISQQTLEKSPEIAAEQPLVENAFDKFTKSPIAYSADDRPLLPVLTKTQSSNILESVPSPVSSPIVQPVTPSPIKVLHTTEDVISIRTYPTFERSSTLRRVRNGVMIVALVFGFLGGAAFISRQSPELSLAQNMSANVNDVLASVGSFFKNSYAELLALFGRDQHLAIETPTTATPTATDTSEPKGMAVVGSTGSPSGDAALKKNIQNSFSDEVVVSPDQGGATGVITPVFRSVKGSDFVYVLVPVHEEKK